MVDAIVGSWKSCPSAMTGLKEYLEAVGHSEMFDQFNNSNCFVVKKDSDTRYSYESSVDGMSEKITGAFEVGAKTMDFSPGLGNIEVDTVLEGDKIVTRAEHNGIQLKKYVYAAGDTLTFEYAAGDVVVKSIAKRM